MGEKVPYIPLYTGDWLKDPKLSMCSPATRGIWIDAICAMHESDRSGSLTGTPDQLARVLHCTPSDLHSAIAELVATGAADVRESNGYVTLINRRMKREYEKRVKAAERQRNHRLREGKVKDVDKSHVNNMGIVTENVTPLSRSHNGLYSNSISDSVSNSDKPSLLSGFEKFWQAYPKKVSKGQAKRIWNQLKPNAELLAKMLEGVEKAKTSAQWLKDGGQFIPHASNWLNAEAWDDEIKPAGDKHEEKTGKYEHLYES